MTTPKLPLCCSPHAFQLMNRQRTHINTPLALINGAVALATHQIETVETDKVLSTLDQYAQTIQSRVRGSQPQALIAHMHEFLFEEEGFSGSSSDDYYSPLNSYLPVVLESKRGLPIVLSLIYKVVADRLGLRAWGVGLPGHFLAAVEVDQAVMLVDPFHQGQEVSLEEAHERIRQVLGAEAEWSEELIQPISNRMWLTRMAQNLLIAFSSKGHYADVAAILEMEMLLWPDQDTLQRDLALVLARLGLTHPASQWLHQYLDNNPDDPQKPNLQQLLQALEA